MNAEWLLLPWNCWKSGIRVARSRLGAKFYFILVFAALIFAFALEASCALNAIAKDLGQAKVSAVISAISPDILTFSEDDKGFPEKITVKGSVTNSSDAAIDNVRVLLRTSSRLATDAKTIHDWVKGSLDKGFGSLRVKTSKSLGQLPAKKSVDFTVEIPTSTLPKPTKTAFGSLAVEAIVTANRLTSKDASAGRSLLLYGDGKNLNAKTKLSVIAPLSASSPEMAKWLATGGAGSTATAGEQESYSAKPLKSVSDNAALVKSLSREGITWVIDPALLQSDSPLLTGSFNPLPERRPPLSLDETMLEALKVAQSKGASLSLDLWGAPDFVQLDEGALTQSAQWNQQVGKLLEKQVLLEPTAVFLANPRWADRADKICKTGDNRLTNGCVFVTGGNQLELTGKYNYQPDLLGQVRLENQTRNYLGDHGDLSALMTKSSGQDAFTDTQLARAILAAIANERPLQPRLVNIALANSALASSLAQQRLSKILSDPWVEPVSLSQALSSSPTPVSFPERSQTSRLAASSASSLGVSGSSFQPATTAINKARSQVLPSLNKITDSPQRISVPLYQQLLLSTSRAMTVAERNQAISNASRQIDLISGAVQIQSSSDINLISDRSEIPIKVLNRLPVQVRVRLQLHPTDARLRADSAPQVSLAPKGAKNIRIPVTAVRNGNVSANVEILSVDGNLVLGKQQQINLRIRSGWENHIFLGFILSAATVFIVGLVLNLRRGTRMERNQEEEE